MFLLSPSNPCLYTLSASNDHLYFRKLVQEEPKGKTDNILMSREGSLLLSLLFPKEGKKKNQTLSSGLYRLSLPTKGVGIPFCRSGFQSQICVSSRVPESEATLSGARLLRSVHLGEEMLILQLGSSSPGKACYCTMWHMVQRGSDAPGLVHQPSSS